jgi:predicted AlkP superfamily pyrophosphatase or phosphodiesterase
VVSSPGLLDAVASAHPDFWTRYVPPNVSDDSLTDVAIHILATGKPRLLLLHLVEIDGAQHRYGIDSPEAKAAIETDDRQLARILAELQRLNLARETALMVVSDHGFKASPMMVRPCVLLREAGLVEVNGGNVTSWKATVLTNSGSAYVYIKDPADYVTREMTRSVFAQNIGRADSGIGRIYEPDEIRANGGDPAAFMALEPVEGYQFGPGCVGEFLAAPQYRATHGFDPQRPEMRASLLMVGPSIVHGKIRDARLVDVGPTIAGFLGLSMPGTDGHPLTVQPNAD